MGQIVGGEQVPDPVVAVVGGATTGARLTLAGSPSSGATSPPAIAYRCSTRAFFAS
jgi:hypothetical protein